VHLIGDISDDRHPTGHLHDPRRGGDVAARHHSTHPNPDHDH